MKYIKFATFTLGWCVHNDSKKEIILSIWGYMSLLIFLIIELKLIKVYNGQQTRISNRTFERKNEIRDCGDTKKFASGFYKSTRFNKEKTTRQKTIDEILKTEDDRSYFGRIQKHNKNEEIKIDTNYFPKKISSDLMFSSANEELNEQEKIKLSKILFYHENNMVFSYCKLHQA